MAKQEYYKVKRVLTFKPVVTVSLASQPYYLSSLKPLMASDLSHGFSHLRPGVFHISLQIRKAQLRRVEEKN